MKPQHSSRLRRTQPKFPNSIRRYRLQLGLTQREVVRQLGVRIETLSCWEGGLTRPTLEMAARLASALQISVQALYPEMFFGPRQSEVSAHAP